MTTVQRPKHVVDRQAMTQRRKGLKRGPPGFKPDPKEREFVRIASGLGLTPDQIAALIRIEEGGMSTESLKYHFRKELDAGFPAALLKVTQSLFNQAVSGKCVAATIFWLKCRGRWTEVNRYEFSGPDGQPLPAQTHGVMLVPVGVDDAAQWEAAVAKRQAQLTLHPPTD